jgi:hypothetical protein
MVVAGEAATSTSTGTTFITGIVTSTAAKEVTGSIIRSIAAGLPMAIEGPPTNLEAGPGASGRQRAIVPAVVDWVVVIAAVRANVVVWVNAAGPADVADQASVAV